MGGGQRENYVNTQRSQDTAGIRGFRSGTPRAAMNLGEDINGTPRTEHHGRQAITARRVGYSTAFPVSMARGAAFDLDLEYAIGEAIGDEMQAAGETLLLAPCMNLLRHPYWGRAQEAYGEDPFHDRPPRLRDGRRHPGARRRQRQALHGLRRGGRPQTNDSDMDEQTLREIYGRHFRMVVQDSGVSSVMASYNAVDGTKSTINRHTLTDVLRNDFGFKGFILSDWWACRGQRKRSRHSHPNEHREIAALNAGLDVELPWLYNYRQPREPLQYGRRDAKPARRCRPENPLREVPLQRRQDDRSRRAEKPVTIYDTKRGRITCDRTHLALAKGPRWRAWSCSRTTGTFPSARRSKRWLSWAHPSRTR